MQYWIIFFISANILLASNFLEDKKFLQGYEAYQYENQFGRWENFWQNRALPSGKYPDITKLYEEYKNPKEDFLDKNLNSNVWEALGPDDIPTNSIPRVASIGRLNCIEFHPIEPHTIFVGAAAGGIWKTTDKGDTWRKLPTTGFMSIGIGDISISKTNPNIIYATTGDAAAVWLFGGYSIGAIKSTDGGETWDIITAEYNIDDGIWMPEVEVHPNEPDIVYLCSNQGLLKTINGGDTWNFIKEGEFFRDFEFKPDDPSIFYASTLDPVNGSNLYKFTNDGEDYIQIYDFPLAIRSEISVVPTAPERLYVVSAAIQWGITDEFIYSTDKGETWQSYEFMFNAEGERIDFLSYQGGYNSVLTVNPNNLDDVFVGGVDLFRTRNNGESWTVVTMDSLKFITTIHVDFHDVKFSPHDSSIYAACDGGLYRLVDDQFEWENLSKGLNITQFYKLAVDPLNPDVVFAGSQDNGVVKIVNGKWDFITSGDGMETIINHQNSNSIYTSTQRGWIYRSFDGGLNVSDRIEWLAEFEYKPWTTPMDMHPIDSGKVLFGFEEVWLTENGLDTARQISDFNDNSLMNCVEFSDVNPNLILVGNSNFIYKTEDQGITWDVVNSVNSSVTDFEFVNDKIYYSLAGFDSENKVILVEDNSFQNLTYNLPNVPVMSIAYDEINNRLIAGTDIGVWYLDEEINQWSRLGTGMPNIIINELEISQRNGKLYAASFGMGVWSYDLFECNSDVEISLDKSGEYRLCEDASIELNAITTSENEVYWSNGKKGDRLIVEEQGDYYASVIDENGCSQSSEIVRVYMNPKPRAKLFLESNNPVCIGDTVKVRLEVDSLLSRNFDVEWNAGNQDGLNAYLTDPGTYFAKIVSEDGCIVYSDSIRANFVEYPPKPQIYREGNLIKTDSEGQFQWFLNGELISGQNENQISILDTGDYKIRLREGFSCFSDSEELNISINLMNGSIPLNVFPNPFKENLQIEVYLDVPQKINFKIYDLMGKVAYEFSENSESPFFAKNYDLNMLAAGSYYLEIRTDNFKELIPIVKVN